MRASRGAVCISLSFPATKTNPEFLGWVVDELSWCVYLLTHIGIKRTLTQTHTFLLFKQV